MQATLMGLLSGAALCTIAPVFLQLPKPMAIASLVSGAGLGLATAALAEASKTQEAIISAEQETLLQILREQMARERSVNQAIARSSALMEYRYWVETNLLPEDQVQALAAFGASPSWMSQCAVINTTAEVMPSRAMPTAAQPATMPAQSSEVVYNYPGEVGAVPYQPPVEMPRIPEEDLAYTLAISTTDKSNATSVLIACPRRTGKSNLVRQAIVYTNALHETNVDFLVWNAGKDDEDYCGLQDSDLDYLFTANEDNIPMSVGLLHGSDDVDSLALIRRCDRWMGKPTVLIGDEWNNTLLAASNLDMISRGQNWEKKLISGSQSIVTRGPGKLVLGWFTSHSAFVSDIGWNTQIQDSIARIVLARADFTQAMHKALYGARGQKPIVPDEDRLTMLQELYEFWYAGDRSRVLALTNLLGEWRLVLLPNYPDSHPPIERGVMNQSVAEITQQRSAGSTPSMDVYAQVKALLEASPTAEDVRAAWQAVTGQRLSEEAAHEFIRALDAGIL